MIGAIPLGEIIPHLGDSEGPLPEVGQDASSQDWNWELPNHVWTLITVEVTVLECSFLFQLYVCSRGCQHLFFNFKTICSHMLKLHR